MRSVPRLCEFNPGICLTTEEKHGKTSVRVVKESQGSQGNSQGSQGYYYNLHPDPSGRLNAPTEEI